MGISNWEFPTVKSELEIPSWTRPIGNFELGIPLGIPAWEFQFPNFPPMRREYLGWIMHLASKRLVVVFALRKLMATSHSICRAVLVATPRRFSSCVNAPSVGVKQGTMCTTPLIPSLVMYGQMWCWMTTGFQFVSSACGKPSSSLLRGQNPGKMSRCQQTPDQNRLARGISSRTKRNPGILAVHRMPSQAVSGPSMRNGQHEP